MQTLPFRFMGTSDLESLEGIVSPAVKAWAKTWFCRNPKASMTLTTQPDTENAEARNNDEWLVFGSGSDAWVAWELSSTSTTDYLQQMFGVDIDSACAAAPLSQEIFRECIVDLLLCCLPESLLFVAKFEPRRASFDSLRTGYGSGAVFCKLVGDIPEQHIVFGGEVANAIVLSSRPEIQPTQRLTARDQAITKGCAPIEVLLGKVELSVGDLIGMTAGDVLSLDTVHHAPLQVDLDGQPLFQVKLGRIDEQKAIQVIAL